LTDDKVQGFYDELADDYHLIFADWRESVRRQGDILHRLIREKTGRDAVQLLDCSCGIGTQAIGLARLGHRVTATDLSPGAVERARREAAAAGVAVEFGVADFRSLATTVAGSFDVVITCDNSLPHLLTDADLWLAAKNMWQKLVPGGLLLISLRDYDRLLAARPRTTEPRVYDGGKRIVFQLWDWLEQESIYTINHFIIRETKGRWETKHSATLYRALPRQELTAILEGTGFADVEWHPPEATGYYQPVVTARKRLRGEA